MSSNGSKLDSLLLFCGALAAVSYVGTDLIASALYPGYSYRAQAVSELFAIGAPTAGLVVLLFSLSSVLLLAFAAGMWRVAGTRRLVRAVAVMFAGSAVIGLLLWNVDPMHMRGAERSFTDTMHLVLASNPFVLLSIVLATMSFPGRFRVLSIVTIVVMVVPAVTAFSYAKALDMNQPTPWLGVTERIAQYAFEAWQIVLSLMLVGRNRAPARL